MSLRESPVAKRWPSFLADEYIRCEFCVLYNFLLASFHDVCKFSEKSNINCVNGLIIVFVLSNTKIITQRTAKLCILL